MKYILTMMALLLCAYSTRAQTIETAKKNTPQVFQYVDQMPEFPGGVEALQTYLIKNIRFPDEAIKKGIEGIVYLQYIVNTDGTISDIKVLRDIGGGCADEAIRVLKNMPKWKPGLKNGKQVAVSYTLPVQFGNGNIGQPRATPNMSQPKNFTPQFPGGDSALHIYLNKNLHYPSIIINRSVSDTVIAEFIVNTTGAIENIQIKGSPLPQMSDETIRLIKSMPKWIPGSQNGEYVKMYYTLPVIFTSPVKKIK